jgi:hypothetical protein
VDGEQEDAEADMVAEFVEEERERFVVLVGSEQRHCTGSTVKEVIKDGWERGWEGAATSRGRSEGESTERRARMGWATTGMGVVGGVGESHVSAGFHSGQFRTRL